MDLNVTARRLAVFANASGVWACVTNDSNDLQTVNVTTPSRPVLSSSLDLSSDSWGIVVSGTVAYVCGQGWVWAVGRFQCQRSGDREFLQPCLTPTTFPWQVLPSCAVDNAQANFSTCPTPTHLAPVSNLALSPYNSRVATRSGLAAVVEGDSGKVALVDFSTLTS